MPGILESVPPGEAVTFQILLGLSVVGMLFYFQSLASEYAKSILGAASVFGGGMLSGGLHALSGPDHLAALLPFILGQKWYKAVYYGSIWGLGHGITASFLGIFGFYVKDSLLGYKLLPQLTNLADYAVGVTLIIIGLMGLHEAQQEEENSSKEHSFKGEHSEDNEECSSIINESDESLLEMENKKNEKSDRKKEYEKIEQQKSSLRISDSLAVPMTIFANGCFLGE